MNNTTLPPGALPTNGYPLETIENRTFDEIHIGDSASLQRRLTMQEIKLFAAMSGDVNPAHVDEDFAKNSRFHHVIAHGMWGGALISTVLGTQLPGPGTLYLGQTLHFHHPVTLGDVVTVTVTAREKDNSQGKHRILFDCLCLNQENKTVISGSAEVMAPSEKIRRPRWIVPEVRLAERPHLHRLLEHATTGKPVVTAVVHPVDRESLLGIAAAKQANLITPILVGPAARIRSAAESAGIALDDYRIEPVEHSHAAVLKALDLIRLGQAQMLMKGSLHTDELMQAVVAKSSGLRTERRMSHVMVFDVPTYQRPLLITDAALNIAPDLATKRDIVQNAIDLARAFGNPQPRVAILSAVETINPNIPTTLDAAALCKMADRGQISGGLVDGPLAFDNAVSAEAARIKNISSPVAGQADILLVPDLESGNMLGKQLEYFGGAECAGIVLGARVPIVLTSRADDAVSRMASCAIGKVLAHQFARSGHVIGDKNGV